MTTPLRFAVLGLGGRGREAYGSWIVRHPDRATIVAAADPVRERFGPELDGAAHFSDWRDLVDALPELAVDAVIVALPDHLHVAAMREVLKYGAPILLEKPIAPSLEQLQEFVAELDGYPPVPIAVGHVLRFTPFWTTIGRLLRSGALGEIVTLEVRENIGFWHFAHSYVRGNWRSQAESSPMALAKTCHDLDLIRWLMGARPETISSAGSLQYFRAENRPEGAPSHCVEGCPVAADCPFYAPRYYVDALSDVHGIPVTLVTHDTSEAGRLRALATSDYGRCVFACDNDVADHQATVMGFAGGQTASLVASAFTAENTRHVSISCTAGQLMGHMESGRITVDLFSPTADLPESLRRHEVARTTRGPLNHRSIELRSVVDGDTLRDHRGHAGGDDGLMEHFVSALESGTSSDGMVIETALDSHYMAFAAEEARQSATTLDFDAWMAATGSTGKDRH